MSSSWCEPLSRVGKLYFAVYSMSIAKEEGIRTTDYTAMKLELASLQSVRDFVGDLSASFRTAESIGDVEPCKLIERLLRIRVLGIHW